MYKRKLRVGCRQCVLLLWVDRLVKVQMPLTRVKLGKVRDVDKRQISSKDASRLMGAVIQTDEGISRKTG